MCKGVEEIKKCVFRFLTWIFKHPCGIGQRSSQTFKFTRRKRGQRDSSHTNWQNSDAISTLKSLQTQLFPLCSHFHCCILLTPDFDRWSNLSTYLSLNSRVCCQYQDPIYTLKLMICLWQWIVFMFKSQHVPVFLSAPYSPTIQLHCSVPLSI